MPNPAYFSQSRRQNQMYVKAIDIFNHFEQNKTRPLNFAGADEMELEAALKESMKTFEA